MDTNLLLPDEPHLAAALESTSRRAVAAFATACVFRLSASLPRGEAALDVLALVLRRLHAFVEREETSDTKAHEATLLAAMPDANEYSFVACLAEDALAAAAYALRYVDDGEVQNAVWAARRAYEAADSFAGEKLPDGTFDSAREAGILRHPVVQTELRRQRRDLQEIMGSGGDPARLVDVLQRAMNEPIVS